MSTFRRAATVCGLTAAALFGLWQWSAADEHQAQMKIRRSFNARVPPTWICV